MSLCLSLAFLGGSPGPMELIVIFLVILVLFGPRRLPEIAKMIGKTLHELRRASEDFKDQVLSIDAESQEVVVQRLREVGSLPGVRSVAEFPATQVFKLGVRVDTTGNRGGE